MPVAIHVGRLDPAVQVAQMNGRLRSRQVGYRAIVGLPQHQRDGFREVMLIEFVFSRA